jgi:hypothetical protein
VQRIALLEGTFVRPTQPVHKLNDQLGQTCGGKKHEQKSKSICHEHDYTNRTVASRANAAPIHCLTLIASPIFRPIMMVVISVIAA